MSTKTRARRTSIAVVTASLLLAGWGGPASAAPYDDRTVFDQGHADLLFVSNEGGKATLQVHDDTTTPTTYADASDYVFHVKPSVAARTANAFIATVPGFTEVGETVYVLPQTSVPGTIFAGFGHSLPHGSVVTHHLTEVDGPGNFAAWQAGDEGPNVFLNQAAGLPSRFSSQAGHEHLAWGFTELGEYQLTFESDVTLAGGQELERSEPQTYTFLVGEELPADESAPVETELTISGLAAHYHAGGVASLSAEQTPATGLDHFHWFTRASGESDWKVVPGALTERYGFVVTSDHDGQQVQARLYDEDHGLVATSAPVTVVVDDHGNSPVHGPTITSTLPENAGALVVSVDPAHETVALGDLELTAGADRLSASGDLAGIRVTDTRSANPGWNVNGRVRAFTTVDGDTLSGSHLGWTPSVLSDSHGQAVVAGDAVASTLSGGNGLSGWTRLASAADGEGVGVAELGAGLTLEAPVSLEPGTYEGLLILTAI
jgi:surface-anchored protein